MPTVQGVGSGLEIGKIVDSLVSAEKAPALARINRAGAAASLQLSAMGQMTSAFSSLQTALKSLNGTDSVFGGRAASSDAPAVFTATAAANAQTGTYSVKVQALASAQKLTSAALPANTGLGAGVLHVVAGSTAFDVTITAGEDTPAKIMSAINAAATTAGAKMNVSLINGDGGSSLVFNSTSTGAANTMVITRTSGSAGLDALVYDPGNLTSLTQLDPAADGQVIINGITRTTASNTLTDAIPGITLNLLTADIGVAHTLTVTPDNTATTKALNTFITSYNAVITLIGQATAFNGIGVQSGPLLGDSMTRGASSQLRNTVGNAIGSLSAVGLNTTVEGKLTLDASKLSTALSADASNVKTITQSLSNSLQTVVGSYVGVGGLFTGRTSNINSKLRGLTTASNNLDIRMEKVRARYQAQYSAMDTLVGQLNGTSAFLTQWASSLTSSNK